jgi:hypothetical protein
VGRTIRTKSTQISRSLLAAAALALGVLLAIAPTSAPTDSAIALLFLLAMLSGIAKSGTG